MSWDYYRIYCRFWPEVLRRGWSDDVRVMALYLMTNNHRVLEGIFYLPVSYAAADLNWTLERVREALAKLVGDGFCDYDCLTNLVLVKKALKYQPPENPNQVTAAIKHLEELPASRLKEDFTDLAERYSPRLAEGLRNRSETVSKPTATTTATSTTTSTAISGKALDTQVASEDVKNIFDHWNGKGNLVTHRRLTDTMKGHVRARLEDYSIEEITGAIDNYSDILASKDHLLDHRWTLAEFSTRAFDKFLTSNDPFTSYKKMGGKEGGTSVRSGTSNDRRVGYGKP